MFNRFSSREDPPASISSAARKINRSCTECTRRKVKCDGGHPCGSCSYYKISHICQYRQRTKRNAVSRSALGEVSDQLQSRTDVLRRLFPNNDLEQLNSKTRSELIDILLAPLRPPTVTATETASKQCAEDEDPDDSGQVSVNGELAVDRQWDEATLHPSMIHAGDDINAINIATDGHRRSYLGIASISAIFRAIFRLCPAAKAHAVEQARSASQIQIPSSLPSFINGQQFRAPLEEQRCIDFYFEHIHSITGMLDETEFRTSYALGTRQEPSWLGLLYMVLALGSIASGSDVLHEQYYQQARSFINFDCLGSGNLESLQALALLGGYYLHYRNSPNMAYAVLGAAQRVAIALGLHREPRRQASSAEPAISLGQISRIETRRRTWWGLFCLDCWASMTLGRPTCGRWDDSTMDTLLPVVAPDDHIAICLNASAQFCLIGNRIQARYAQFGRMTAQELIAFDNELQGWRDDLPEILQSSTNSPSRITIAREFMRNRYLNVRLILLRSQLLYLANGRIRREDLSPEEHQLIGNCRTVACEAVDAAALNWTSNRVHVWNSAWYLFQASMVLLLSIVVESRAQMEGEGEGEEDTIDPLRNRVRKALHTFTEMRPWMRDSDRSPEIVAVIFEAVTSDASALQRTPSGTDRESNFFGWYDEQFHFGGEPDWGSILLEDEMQRQLLPRS